MKNVRLMLLDTYGLVYRAFFALPPLTTTRGVPIHAAYGFTMMLNKLIQDEKPTHLIACFDQGVPQARLDMFKQYKAQRTAMPDDLRPQFALVRQILEVFNIPIMEQPGQEADDVMATLARQAEEQKHPVVIVTGDLDLLQVVRDGVTALVTRRGITDLGRYDVAAVRQRFQLEPAQLADYRGLKGDPSDNLPGVPGVGEKTAIKLIQAAGSLDALLANPVLAGTPKLQQLIEEHGQQARICRDVSIIRSDLDVCIDWEHSLYQPPHPDKLYQLYRELEFKTLLNRLPVPQEMPALASETPLQGLWQSYLPPTDLGDHPLFAEPYDYGPLIQHLGSLRGSTTLALSLRGDEIGLSVQAGTGLAFRLEALRDKQVRAHFGQLWEGASQRIGYNIKAILGVLTGFPVLPFSDDPMIAAHLLNPARAYANVADAAAEFLGLSLVDQAATQADAALQLAGALRATLEEREQTSLYVDIELPVAAILFTMERAGVAIDPSELKVLDGEIEATMARLQSEIFALAGDSFNIASPQQLGVLLFEKMAIPGGKKNKTGWGTGVDVLQALANEHPICDLILEYREVAKLKNTYIDVIPKLTSADGRLRTVFNQTVTATGRLSSTHPNLQNIPVRGELGRRIRRAFVAPNPERVLLAADYSQIELRLMAHLSGDAAMRQAFQEGQDIHDFTARQIFNVGQGQVEANQRRIAKSVNFGLLYGMSDFGLAQRLEIGRAEAKEMTSAYFARFPSVKAFISGVIQEGREKGYVSTILKRRRYIPALRSANYLLRSAAEREATNAPIQGSASDLMKLAMVRIDVALGKSGLDAQMLLQIHDELIFEVARHDLEAVAHLVRHQMENALSLSVPIEATLKSGANWYDVASYSELAAGDVHHSL